MVCYVSNSDFVPQDQDFVTGRVESMQHKLDPLLLLGAARAESERTPDLAATHETTSANVSDLPIGLLSLAGGMSTTAAERVVRDNLVPVLIETRNPGDVVDQVEKLGGKAVPVGRTAVSARVRRDTLARLADLRTVDYVEASVRLDYSLDHAHRSARLLKGEAPTVRQTGNGVLIGVVDSGIDTAHPAFRNGITSRIVDYLDQEIDRQYDQTAINAGKATASPDVVGHGTHVAGIAAGNGGGSPRGGWRGVAPAADLAIVKTTMDTVDIATGVEHIFNVADERGQPCVVNLSLGGHYGAHDGSSVVERTIDDLSGPGRIVTVAAGNEGSARLHAGIDLDPARTEPARWVADFELEVQLIQGQLLGMLTVQIWHQHEDTLRVQLRSPIGELFSVAAESTADFDRGSIYVEAQHSRARYNGDHVTTFAVFTSPQSQYRTGWSIIVDEAARGDAPVGAVHAWILRQDMGHFSQGDSQSFLVGMPGTAFSAITVAAYATRKGWAAEPDGGSIQRSAVNLEEIGFFSSPGPARDRQNKPDIAAPGQWLLAPLSSAAPVSAVPGWQRAWKHPYAAMQGTSMAAPYVAGAIALLLEESPRLDWAEVKRRIINTARQDRFTRPGWNARWGYGKLDVEKLLEIEPNS